MVFDESGIWKKLGRAGVAQGLSCGCSQMVAGVAAAWSGASAPLARYPAPMEGPLPVVCMFAWDSLDIRHDSLRVDCVHGG